MSQSRFEAESAAAGGDLVSVNTTTTAPPASPFDGPELLYVGPLLVIEKEYGDPALRPKRAELGRARTELTARALVNALRSPTTSRATVDGALASGELEDDTPGALGEILAADIANYLLSNVTMRAAVRGRFIEMLKTAAEIQHDSDTEETVNDAITTMIFENMPLIKIDTFKEDLKDLSELVNDISARTMATTRATTTTSSRGLSMETRDNSVEEKDAEAQDAATIVYQKSPITALLNEPGLQVPGQAGTSVGLGIAKAGNKQAGTTSRYRDTGNEC